MAHHHLNIEYAGLQTDVIISNRTSLGDIRMAIKERLEIPVPDYLIRLYSNTNKDQEITTWDQLNGLSQGYFDSGSLFLSIQCATAPTPTEHEDDGQPKKRQRIQINDLTAQLKLFSQAQIVDQFLQTPDYLPFPEELIKVVYVRKCYQEVFDLLLEKINLGFQSFGISGTPGIGKSLFFCYIVYRLMEDRSRQSLSFKPQLIVYQSENDFYCFQLQEQIVTAMNRLEARQMLRQRDLFYIIDGYSSVPVAANCVSLFISSPRSEHYKKFVQKKNAREWYFPVWTLEELTTCHDVCYPTLKSEVLEERYHVYGGVARILFDSDVSIPVHQKMHSILADTDAVRGVRYVGVTTDIYPQSHTLMHIIVGKDQNGNDYQFTGLDVASKYVGEQLWTLSSAQMITNLQQMFGGSPNEISRHLFEIYGHLIFSRGDVTLKCRCLEENTDTVTNWKLEKLSGERKSFGKKRLPQAADLVNSYFELSDEDNFPAIDSLSSCGMFQFTVAEEHPIRGMQILEQLCDLYLDPKLYFVVPTHRFAQFKKQKFKVGANDAKDPPKLKQYVLELPVPLQADW